MASPCPDWLRQRLAEAGGSVPFRTYMQWVLHDPEHGAYGAGRLRIGPDGDFATSPSLGPDFASLLVLQLAEWFAALAEACGTSETLALIETGPGEGSLAAQLAGLLAAEVPELLGRLELVLVEPNPGMAERQRQRLTGCPLPCRWLSFAELAAAPVRGVMLAHEVLDALAVERIVSDGEVWRRQRVQLGPDGLQLVLGEPLEAPELQILERLGLTVPGPGRADGWCSELHPGVGPWLGQAAAALQEGWLLVIDYALEAARYYRPSRSDGTLMAYRSQRASGDPLLDPGQVDLTAHLCVESFFADAEAAGWSGLGHCRQGEALLALGLAERLHGLQQQGSAEDLATLLRRREALLRLVDPHALGEFRWLAFRRGATHQVTDPAGDPPLFLREPPLS